ncbi:uncharacterized protein K444DRAFT_668383 [Hyaloscypha bicolor E]|uniref:Uncharacterized protein n=1 Tax=Hyaloscypha bicolor E TaxID=1095630 RepID=A0A2J6SPI6_9HELO|nr:uncharacterized protein K444DRAFT_668383 [Hyaloscypha bicolor E]PMD52698.1 hypothetical protein K444DRAFT_668383 [Hyaloscypha bicolor E]
MSLLQNATIADTSKLGWVRQPNHRGTIDIIWACLLLIFISTWTVLHINLPAPGESYWSIQLRKARWSAFLLYAPEVMTMIAACQRASARTSVENMHALGAKHWTVVHGLFAESGGFVLHSPDMPPFPINNRAIYYLAGKSYIEVPSVTKDEIQDHSKKDRVAKVVAIVQGTYMIAQCIARAIQHMQISNLELVTVAFVGCTCVTFFLWIDKPCGVEKAIDIFTTVHIRTIIVAAGDVAAAPYGDTPLDFVEQPGWQQWRRRERFRKVGIPVRPLERIPNDYVVPPLTLRLAVPLWGLTVLHAATHILAWDFPFPTTFELWLWRAASLAMTAVMIVWGFAEVLSVKPGFDYTMTLLGIWEKRASKDTFFRNWAVDGPGTCSAILYGIARTIIIIETFASLRLMDASAYDTVNWTQFLPHV